MQHTFNPVNYLWTWTKDWYEWNSNEAHLEALKDRNKEANKLIKAGRKVKKWSQRNCTISKGGIGSGKPHVEVVVTVYGFDVM